MEARTELTDKYYRLYKDNVSRIKSSSFPLFNSVREESINRFASVGFPTKKDEAYRYTDLATIFDYDYKDLFIPGPEDFAKAEKFSCSIEDIDSYGIILFNGFYPPVNNNLNELPGDVWLGSLTDGAKKFPSLVEEHFGKYARIENDGLIALNSAMAFDGVFIYVPDGTNLNKPIQLINFVDSEADIFNQNRNLIIAGKNSSFSLIICDHTLSPGRLLTNNITEVYVDENARFDIIRVQNEHNNAYKILNTFICQEHNSVVYSNNITLHGGLVRNSTSCLLKGEKAECNFLGLHLSDKSQHIDNYVNVEHLAANCTSNQLFKGVFDDKATGVFTGRVYVSKGAQGTSAYQKTSSIILTPDAKMNARPQLEIFADDVRCSHGATVGQLDENAMFYMQSRGISRDEARRMLMFAFADEVIKGIPVKPLRKRMNELVMQRLRGELTRCALCMIKCS
ncbi:MAG: Fe-S cluster assembly protein SufD [Bacteroidales bacterium]|nr:Fe-S cluster assembly protein SufD [Bacteroidales bacterium]